MIGGVSGGLAEYFDVDPVLVRVLWVVTAILSGGLMVLVYVVMAIITPNYSRIYGVAQPLQPDAAGPTAGGAEAGQWDDGGSSQTPREAAQPQSPRPPVHLPQAYGARRGGGFAIVLGTGLIVIGGIALLNAFDVFGFYNPWKLWPLVLVGLGLALLLRRRNV